MKRGPVLLAAAAAISVLPLMRTARAGDALPTLEEYAKAHPPANSTGHHTWFQLNYAVGKCVSSASSPEEVYKWTFLFGSSAGIIADRVSADDVTKDDKGVIHVRMTGKKGDVAIRWDFFTTVNACEQFISDNDIKPTQADSGDIN
jgi:hypothetical protein